ncbi:MAG: hypothetical protein EXQ91_00685 [Alphaproteobacteria bacterium]|nr:hypothetical protein [Alphaproteobacteria bacterium]
MTLWYVFYVALAVAITLATSPSFAGKEKIEASGETGVTLAQATDEDRRRPGRPVPDRQQIPAVDSSRVPPPQPTLPRETIPVPDRWRIVESIGVNSRWWDPYNQNMLKGDRPVFDDWFVNLSVILDAIYEPRRFPNPTGTQATTNANAVDQFGKNKQTVLAENLITTLSFIKGNTAYQPPDYEIRIGPVFNHNKVVAEEVGLLYADPAKGRTRSDQFVGWQELFLDYHIRNVSDRFDFDSIRLGIQPFQLDFRGFLFQDLQLGARLFGNRDNNFWQYNVGWVRRLEKDTNSGLNDIGAKLRDDDVYFVNLFRQDWPVLGFTSQAVVAHNRNNEDDRRYFNENEFQERPAPIGDQRPRKYHVTYLGLNGDGHFGRLNLTGSLYYAFGKDELNQFAGDGSSADIRAYFAATEASWDFSWIRVRAQAAYASGDNDPTDGKEGGFAAIFENPQFAGSDTSYFIRQSIPFIGGGGTTITSRNGMLTELRTSKEHGQSNFINPGLILAGFGTDMDLSPQLRVSTNFNHLSFATTDSLEFLRNQNAIGDEIGYDLSVAFTYRPHFTQNVVFRLSGAWLIPGDGFRDIYRARTGTGDDFFYSVLGNVTLTY